MASSECLWQEGWPVHVPWFLQVGRPLLCDHSVSVMSLVCRSWRSAIRCTDVPVEDGPSGLCACECVELAASRGDVGLLSLWMRAIPAARMRWSEFTAYTALRAGHAEFLEVLLRGGCPFGDDVCCEVAYLGLVDCLRCALRRRHFTDAPAIGAASGGRLACLRLCLQMGCVPSSAACTAAASAGALECLRCLVECGACMSWETSHAAASAGSLECINLCREFLCPWDAETCSCAARAGSVEVLQYCHDSRCPWDRSTPEVAARYGRLACLRYAHENGCLWNAESMCWFAVLGRSSECLQYCLDNSCTWTADAQRQMRSSGTLEMTHLLQHRNLAFL